MDIDPPPRQETYAEEEQCASGNRARKTAEEAATKNGGTRPGRMSLRSVEVLPTTVTPQTPSTDNDPTRRATPTPTATGRGGAMHALAIAPTPTMPAIAEEDEYSLTPTPTGGFPEVHHARPESLTEDLAQRRVNDLWKHDQDRVVLAHVANIGFPTPGQRLLISVEVTGLIRTFTGETDFVVVSPEPEWVEPPARRRTPRTWAVLGLSSAAAARVIDKGALSSIWVTIIAYGRKLVIPRYLFTLTGFTNNYNDNIRTAILEAFASDPIYSSILSLAQGHPELADLDPDDATAEILATLSVRIDKLHNGNLQAAIFCDSPTTSGAKWLEWRHRLMALPFESSYNPTATAKPIELCACCHSADHVTHLCKFPNIPGWNAPPPDTRSFGRPRRQLTSQMPATETTTGPEIRGRGRGWTPARGGRYLGRAQERPGGMYHMQR